MAHYEEEEAAGSEIWPATPKHAKTVRGDEEVALCEKLDCADGSLGQRLAW